MKTVNLIDPAFAKKKQAISQWSVITLVAVGIVLSSLVWYSYKQYCTLQILREQHHELQRRYDVAELQKNLESTRVELDKLKKREQEYQDVCKQSPLALLQFLAQHIPNSVVITSLKHDQSTTTMELSSSSMDDIFTLYAALQACQLFERCEICTLDQNSESQIHSCLTLYVKGNAI